MFLREIVWEENVDFLLNFYETFFRVFRFKDENELEFKSFFYDDRCICVSLEEKDIDDVYKVKVSNSTWNFYLNVEHVEALFKSFEALKV